MMKYFPLEEACFFVTFVRLLALRLSSGFRPSCRVPVIPTNNRHSPDLYAAESLQHEGYFRARLRGGTGRD